MAYIAKTAEGKVLTKGDEVETFRGEKVLFQSVNQHGRNRVYCIAEDGRCDYEWFPSGIDCTIEWVE